MGVFVISQGGKRLLCMADEVAEEVVSVEVHVDGMTIRGAARREAAEEARRMAENDVNVEDNYDAIWDVIAAHGAKLNVMQNELMELLPPKRRLPASVAASPIVMGTTTYVYSFRRNGKGQDFWYFDKPDKCRNMPYLSDVLSAKPGTCTCTQQCTTTTPPTWEATGQKEEWPVSEFDVSSYSFHKKQLYTATCPACTSGTPALTGI